MKQVLATHPGRRILDPIFRALPPLSLYIHVPWCVRKCPYCDFNSHEARGAVPQARYVAALIADLERALPAVWGRSVRTVFFGGGTPSLFDPQAIETVLCAVRARLALSPEAEITLEANPGTVDAARFRGFRAAGVNRLSLGIQSFDAASLRALGRIHDGDEARRAIALARESFENVNLDLMYGLPGQSPDGALADVEEALRFEPAHLSCYHLTIEPNTAFHHRPPPLPEEDVVAAMQDALEGRLEAAGYDHYEVSAYARCREKRDGRRETQRSIDDPVHPPSSFVSPAACRHNLNYWTFGDYLGLGAGAHSKLSFPGRVVRQVRPRHPERYMAAAERGEALWEEHEVPPADLPFEFMMNALRLTAGFPASEFEERTGLPIGTVERELQAAQDRGLISRRGALVAPTALGRRYLNDLLQLFLRDAPAGRRLREQQETADERKRKTPISGHPTSSGSIGGA